jgi:hypothetical protein
MPPYLTEHSANVIHSGWSYVVDTTTLSNGPHSLAIQARDAMGDEAALPRRVVTVSN